MPLIIDVRYNGGGSTTDYLMAVLNYKQHAYTIPRGASDNLEKDKLKFRDYYPTGERLVYAAWLKPSIAICNEGSYSNAEIFSHAYKQLGVGQACRSAYQWFGNQHRFTGPDGWQCCAYAAQGLVYQSHR
jgi:C-terminal processing protease CtpA/Prc